MIGLKIKIGSWQKPSQNGIESGWILSTGTWNDSEFWVDSETWKDL